jgi:hypothetical protein
MNKEEARVVHLKLLSVITDTEYCDLLIYDILYSLVEGCQLRKDSPILPS